MIYVSRLLSLGALTERQARAANRFQRDPHAWRSSLPPTSWELLDEFLVKETPVQLLEEKHGWADRSGKVVLGVLLTLMEESSDPPPSAPSPPDEDTIEDLRARIEFLTAEDGEVIDVMQTFRLPRTAARLLLILLREKGRALPRETIWRRLYAETPEADWPDTKIIDVLICRVRARLAEDGRYEIQTVHGAGFRLIDRAVENSRSARAAS